jgi:adenosylcobinamide-GDP ribazoletransferase
MRGFLGAVSLLTRVPATRGADTERALPWLPVVGALLGTAGAGVYAVARLVLPPFVAASLAVSLLVLLTGALHEDGLADTADAFGAGADRARTLEILKDPRHGTYGVLALVLSILLRIGTLAVMSGWIAAAVLPAAQALSRATAPSMMWLLPAAKPAGLGASYAEHLTLRRVVASVVAAVAIGIAVLGLWTLPAILVVTAAAILVGRLALTKIGGTTGDVLGAAQQLSEIAVLVLMAATLPHLPWWHGPTKAAL